MRIRKIIAAVCMSAAVAVSSSAVYAKDVEIDTDVYQPDEISGHINLKATTEADVHFIVYKNTPDTDKEEYIVYNTVITADSVHVSNNYIFDLEYNNLDFEKGTYEGNYEIKIGVDRLASPDLEEIAYTTIKLVVEDENYCGTETFCNININITEEPLEQPLCVESGDKYNKTYDLTFSNISVLQNDANNDGKVNVRDCAYIASMLAQGNVSTLTMAADVNGDGKVNVRDAAALALILASGNSSSESTTPTEPDTDPTESETTTTVPVQTGVSTETTQIVVTDPIEPSITESPIITAKTETLTTTEYLSTTVGQNEINITTVTKVTEN